MTLYYSGLVAYLSWAGLVSPHSAAGRGSPRVGTRGGIPSRTSRNGVGYEHCSCASCHDVASCFQKDLVLHRAPAGTLPLTYNLGAQDGRDPSPRPKLEHAEGHDGWFHTPPPHTHPRARAPSWSGCVGAYSGRRISVFARCVLVCLKFEGRIVVATVDGAVRRRGYARRWRSPSNSTALTSARVAIVRLAKRLTFSSRLAAGVMWRDVACRSDGVVCGRAARKLKGTGSAKQPTDNPCDINSRCVLHCSTRLDATVAAVLNSLAWVAAGPAAGLPL